MFFSRSRNPALNPAMFHSGHSDSAMTVAGTVNKIITLLVLLIFSGSFAWKSALEGGSFAQMGTIYAFMIAGLVVGLITRFNPQNAYITAPIYTLLQGGVLGAISGMFSSVYDGVVGMAFMATIGVFATMLFCYKTGIIVPTERFKAGLSAAVGGVFFAYMGSFIMRLMGFGSLFGGPYGILISLVIVVIASLCLINDFHVIEQGAANRAPDHMEWYAAFGLMVTVIWLYLEILRLIALSQRRR